MLNLIHPLPHKVISLVWVVQNSKAVTIREKAYPRGNINICINKSLVGNVWNISEIQLFLYCHIFQQMEGIIIAPRFDASLIPILSHGFSKTDMSWHIYSKCNEWRYKISLDVPKSSLWFYKACSCWDSPNLSFQEIRPWQGCILGYELEKHLNLTMLYIIRIVKKIMIRRTSFI